MNTFVYLLFAAPFVVILLHTLAVKPIKLWQVVLAVTTLAAGAVALFYGRQEIFTWVLLVPATLGVIYARNWLSGFESFLVVFPSFSFLAFSISRIMPTTSAIMFRYSELLTLPVNIGIFVVPPLLLWYIWGKLPYVYARFTNADLAEAGISIAVRFRVLAIITILALGGGIFYYTQYTSLRQAVNNEVSSARSTMFYEMMEVEYFLNNRDRDWLEPTRNNIADFRNATRRVTGLVAGGGVATDSYFFLLSDTLPNGFDKALQQADSLSEQDFVKLSKVARSVGDAIQTYYTADALNPKMYKQMADYIVQVIQESGATNLFNVVYTP